MRAVWIKDRKGLKMGKEIAGVSREGRVNIPCRMDVGGKRKKKSREERDKESHNYQVC